MVLHLAILGAVLNTIAAFIMLKINQGTAIINMAAAAACMVCILTQPTDNTEDSND